MKSKDYRINKKFYIERYNNFKTEVEITLKDENISDFVKNLLVEKLTIAEKEFHSRLDSLNNNYKQN